MAAQIPVAEEARREEREVHRQLGKSLFIQELEQENISFDKFIKNSSWLDKVTRWSRVSSLDEFLIHVGFGKISPKNVLTRLLEKSSKKEDFLGKAFKKEESKSQKGVKSGVGQQGGIMVSGLDNVLITIAKCCRPIPGDEILGYVTRGRGVTIHRFDCEKGLDLDPARRIDVCWSDKANRSSVHEVGLRVETKDKPGVASEVTSCISACGASIIKANIHLNKQNVGVFYIKISVKSLEELQSIMAKIECIAEVLSVERWS